MCVGCDGEPVDRRSFVTRVASAIIGMAIGYRSARSNAQAGLAESQSEEQKSSKARALDDPAIQHGMVTFKSGDDLIEGYLARPKAAGQYPAVLVLHGGFGVPEWNRNATAQLAQNGFVALAYKRFGRWPDLTEQDLIQSDQTDQRFRSGSFNEQELKDARAAINYLESQPFVRQGGVGVIGFCGGGYQALLLSTRSKDIRAVVAFYAPPEMTGQYQHPKDPKPSLMDKVKQIKVPVQGHYGADDPIVSLEAVRRFERALKAKGTPVSFFIYEGATHAFYDYTRQYYNAEAASRAKTRMLDFLKEQLK